MVEARELRATFAEDNKRSLVPGRETSDFFTKQFCPQVADISAYHFV
jgi:hypothetical protein